MLGLFTLTLCYAKDSRDVDMIKSFDKHLADKL